MKQKNDFSTLNPIKVPFDLKQMERAKIALKNFINSFEFEFIKSNFKKNKILNQYQMISDAIKENSIIN